MVLHYQIMAFESNVWAKLKVPAVICGECARFCGSISPGVIPPCLFPWFLTEITNAMPSKIFKQEFFVYHSMEVR